MIIDGENINIDDVIASDEKFLKKRKNGLLLSDEDIKILELYDIDYLKFQSLESLIFEISQVLDEYSGDITALEELNIKLGEYNYYHYTNK